MVNNPDVDKCQAEARSVSWAEVQLLAEHQYLMRLWDQCSYLDIETEAFGDAVNEDENEESNSSNQAA